MVRDSFPSELETQRLALLSIWYLREYVAASHRLSPMYLAQAVAASQSIQDQPRRPPNFPHLWPLQTPPVEIVI